MPRIHVVALLLAILCASCARHAAPDPWQVVTIPTDADFTGAWFADSLNGWITGGGWDIDGGIVGRTRDGGRTWRFTSGVIPGGDRSVRLGRVQFLDSLRGCVAGGRDMLLTDDGGATWRAARSAGGPPVPLFDVQYLDEHLVWAVGPGELIRSEDGGENWRRLVRSENDNGYLTGFALHFVDESRGWLASNGGQLFRSDDGGRNWTRVPLPLDAGDRPTLRDVTFLDAMHGWVVGEHGVILHTGDGGATWERQANGVPDVRPLEKGEKPRHDVVASLDPEPERLQLFAVGFADLHRGWAVGDWSDVAESVVLGTRDGGETWSIEHVQKGELLRALCVRDSTHAWAAGDRARTSPQVVLRYVATTR